MLNRRDAVVGAAALAAGCATAHADAAKDIAAIEARIGGRLGVFAINSANGASIAHRPSERFAMASTFKWLLSSAVLKACEDGQMLRLDLEIGFDKSMILPNSPVTEAALDPATGRGKITVEKLCEAIITVSDNCGANLLLDGMIDPAGLTRFIRSTGDAMTRLDRRELELNENAPGDPRDTTTPEAMARSMLKIATTDAVLNAASREKLTRWLAAASTGLDRLRAGFPKNWRSGDKTGTGRNGAHNDVAIAWPPGRPPIVIASYISESRADETAKGAAHADVARLVSAAWGA